MSEVEIYTFDKEGNACHAGEARNAARGAMAIWRILEDAYLPPMQDDSILQLQKQFPNYKPSRLNGTSSDMQEVWNLAKDERLPQFERIVMITTFDKVVVQKAVFATVIDAFIQFDKTYPGRTNLLEQVEVLKEADEDGSIAVAWNQTSVNDSMWQHFVETDDSEDEKEFFYNLNVGKDHYYPFSA